MRKIVLLISVFCILSSIGCGCRRIDIPSEQASMDSDDENSMIVELNGVRYKELVNSIWGISTDVDYEYIGTARHYDLKYNLYLSEDKKALRVSGPNGFLTETWIWRLVDSNLELPEFTTDNVNRIEVTRYKEKEEIVKVIESDELEKSFLQGFYQQESSISVDVYIEALHQGQVGVFGDITIYAKEYEWLQFYSRIYFIGENCYVGTYDGSDRFVYIPKEVLAEVFDIPLSELNPEDYWEPWED